VKGVELPINILVIVAIAVIVLLGLVAMYFLGIGPFSNTVAMQAAKSEGCREYLNQVPPCSNIANVTNITWKQESMNFSVFMSDIYRCVGDACARMQCGCSGY